MAKNLKKWAGAAVASVLSLSMVFSLAACGGNNEPPVSQSADASLPIGDKLELTAPASSGVTWTSSDTQVATVSSSGVVEGIGEGLATITATVSGGESTSWDIVVGKSFTYKAAVSSSPTTWNPHTWENNTDSIILGYISMGFYDVQLKYDETGAVVGFEWAYEMAAADPEDVTEDYVGKYGVESGDERKAWRISLNQDAVWQNGDEIKADEYIYSMQQLLDPTMFNRRSDSYTGRTFSIYGARNYLYSTTQATYETVRSQGYETNQAAIDAGKTLYLDMWNFYGLEGAEHVISVNEETGEVVLDESENAPVCAQWTPITDTTLWFDPAYYSDMEDYEAGIIKEKPEMIDYVVSAASIWAAYKDMLEPYSQYENNVALYVPNEHLDYAWDWQDDGNGGVGLVQVDDYTLDIILDNEIDDFYLHYNLTSNCLVHRETYEKTKDEANGVNRYNTGSVANTMSYGPYVLTSFEFDSHFTLARNENWYGYTDGKHNGQYSTTNLDYTYVSGETAKAQMKEMFMLGNLSDYTIDGTEWSTYGNSRYIMSEPESYAYQFFLATDRSQDFLDGESSASENHKVLGLSTFRKALSFSINRQSYITRFEPTSDIGLGLLNDLYIYNPDTGEAYRDTDAAKETILKVQDYYEKDGVWYNVHGEAQGSLDDAYDSLTGFDLSHAADLMEQAYQEAVHEGIYDGEPVVITYCTVGSGVSENLQALIDMINGMLADVIAACDQPTFKSVSLKVQLYADEATYWEALKAGKMDLSFSAWGGSAMDPWGIIYSCYIDSANSNNFEFDSVAKGIDITINYNGKDVVASLYDWAAWLYNAQSDNQYDKTNLYNALGVAVGEAEYDFKLEVLAQCELAQLQTYSNLPIFYSYITSLRSAQYNNGSDYYVNNMIGYGGIRHIYYNYSDAQWSNFVQGHNGNLESYYTAS